MNERRMRSRCRRLLDTLDVQAPLDVTTLCERLAAHRGREIRLMPYALKVPGPFGLWFDTDHCDVIVYQAETPEPHQDHIILHEVGHIVEGHGPDANRAEEREFESLLPFDGVRRRLRRACYHNRMEHGAELIASILGEATGLTSHPAPATVPTSEPAAVQHLRSTLSYRMLGTCRPQQWDGPT